MSVLPADPAAGTTIGKVGLNEIRQCSKDTRARVNGTGQTDLVDEGRNDVH